MKIIIRLPHDPSHELRLHFSHLQLLGLRLETASSIVSSINSPSSFRLQVVYHHTDWYCRFRDYRRVFYMPIVQYKGYTGVTRLDCVLSSNDNIIH